jgi:hypothetical protein
VCESEKGAVHFQCSKPPLSSPSLSPTLFIPRIFWGGGKTKKNEKKKKKNGEKVFLNDNPSVSASIPSIFHPQELFFSSRLFILISPGNTVYYYLLYWNFLWELY